MKKAFLILNSLVLASVCLAQSSFIAEEVILDAQQNERISSRVTSCTVFKIDLMSLANYFSSGGTSATISLLGIPAFEMSLEPISVTGSEYEIIFHTASGIMQETTGQNNT